MAQKVSYFPLGGGLDLVTPEIAKPPGRVVAALNYEPVANGYRRIAGFERFDGHTSPSSHHYYALHFNTGDSDALSIDVGEEINQAFGGGSTWSATVISELVVTSGTFAGGNAVGYVLVALPETAVLGVFTPGSALRDVGGTQWAVAVSLVEMEDVPEASDPDVIATVTELLRAQIGEVPGSGPVRGVWFFDGLVLAVRDNVGATKGVLFKATTAGWVQTTAAYALNFNSGGTAEVFPFMYVRGNADLSPTARVREVIVNTGTWAGGDAAGVLYVDADADVGSIGAFTAGETLTLLGPDGSTTISANVATTVSTGSAPDLPAGGEYQFVNHNFYGASNHRICYGVNGVGKAFEFDGNGFHFITTGMTLDKPTKIAVHRDSLFLGFPGGSVQFSSPGEPTIFDPVVGAGEIGIGDEITDFISANAGTLAILGENSVNVLYGYDNTDYQLEVLSNDSGALAHTSQRVGDVLYMDHIGIRKLSTTASFGNFQLGAISRLITPLLEDFHHDGIEPAASFTIRHRDQYWVFFSGGVGLVMYLGKKDPEILPVNLDLEITCACSAEAAGDLDERVFLGCDDGFVYEFDRGTSFDGDEIEHYLRLPFNHFGAPNQIKRAHKVVIDMQVNGTASLSISVDLDKGSTQGIPAQPLIVTTGGAAIDDLGSNELYYASQVQTEAETYISGIGRNMSLKISGSTDDEEPHTLTGVTYYITPLEQKL